MLPELGWWWILKPIAPELVDVSEIKGENVLIKKAQEGSSSRV
jgi:hypothetical protein